MSVLVDHIIANLEEVRLAHEASPTTELERQDQYVKLQARCNRCGDLTYSFFPGPAPFCGDCTQHFRDTDREAFGDFMWYGQMEAKIRAG